MALINCPRCGGKVSERAQQCPHCGCTKQEIEQIAKKQAAQRREWWETNKKQLCIALAIIIGVIVGVKIIKVTTNANSNYFSVSSSKRVCFSPGNLQYHPKNKQWRFAPNQWDYIGGANRYISSSYNGWLDLFGWSTGTTYFGVSTSTDYDDYYGDFVDWGKNKIGTEAPNTWRTLSYNEWYYIMFERPNADNLNGTAKVNGVIGLMLLPDNWICPSGVTFKSGYWDRDTYYYDDCQIFTADQWSKLENAGAVFLPIAGVRGGSDVDGVQEFSSYWSATEFGNDVGCIHFYSSEAGMSSHYRNHGLSVRLVKDL